MDMTEAGVLLGKIKENIGKAVIGKDDVIDLVLIAMLCGGHVLIEDVPGLGKTTLVSALARSLSCSFNRIQFTPDVLPSDVTGFTMFNIRTGEKEIQKGGVMSQIVLADEINRTSPKTQSALLEAMQEAQVTIDGTSYPVPQPFMVLATQNPIELTGTYPLPEAQLDRFLMKIPMGYPVHADEVNILSKHRSGIEPETLEPIASAQDVIDLKKTLLDVTCAEPVMNYIVDIAAGTRCSEDISLGVSPRGSIALMNASIACAMLSGREYVIPDDVQRMLSPVLAHRLVMHPQASLKGQTAETALRAVIRTIRVPFLT